MASRLLFSDYVASLPPIVLARLYEDPWVVHAVFRSLPSVAQSYVLRMVSTDPDEGLDPQIVDNWANKEDTAPHEAALDRLEALRIVIKSDGADDDDDEYSTTTAASSGIKCRINATFRVQMEMSLTGRIKRTWTPLETSEGDPTLRELDEYAESQWERVLHFLVGSDEEHTPSDLMMDTLQHAGLLRPDSGFRFKFLLMDVYSQVWIALVSFVEAAADAAFPQKDVISFLLQLSFAGAGVPYAVSSLTSAQQSLLDQLSDLGLLFICDRDGEEVFFPSRLAVNLMTGTSGRAGETDRDKFIVVETNFRLYAYTSSKLKLGLLSLFADVEYALPNMAMALITRQSIRKALITGISATEIIKYLNDHAHPEMVKLNNPPLPETVSDQIRLWEIERSRIHNKAGTLLSGFEVGEYYETMDYARKIGVLLYADDKTEVVIVDAGAANEIEEHLARFRDGKAF